MVEILIWKVQILNYDLFSAEGIVEGEGDRAAILVARGAHSPLADEVRERVLVHVGPLAYRWPS